MLDPIHNQGLRLALGAFRTSPVASLYVEADEPSLYSQREKLSLQYAIRLAANPSNPAHEVTFPPNYVDLYEQKPKFIKSFSIRISPLLESTNIKPQNIEKHFTPNIPAWCMKPPEILLIYIPGKNLNQIHTYYNTISENCKIVIRITNKFILMGQRKTQRLVVLLYQTTIVICNIYLRIHQFSLLKPKQLI